MWWCFRRIYMKNELQEAIALEKRAQEIRWAVAEQNRKQEQAKLDAFVKANYNAYSASDYAGVVMGGMSFYYGYEERYCKKHKASDCECDEREWCFLAQKDKEKLLVLTRSDLWPDARHESPEFYLAIGIARYYQSLSPPNPL